MSHTHLIKFIDETHPFVSEHQCPSLQCPLPCDRAALDIRRQTYCRRSLPSSEDSTRGNFLYVLEELGLGSAGVTTEEDVDVTSYLVLLT